MNKFEKIKNKTKYWIKTLKLKQKFIIKEATKQQKKENIFSGYSEIHFKYENGFKKQYALLIFNPKTITLRDISNHIDRVILHELGHIVCGESEYKAEKYMLSILYKYNIRLYEKLINFMQSFLSNEDMIYCFQYPEHYKAFCRVYNVTNRLII